MKICVAVFRYHIDCLPVPQTSEKRYAVYRVEFPLSSEISIEMNKARWDKICEMKVTLVKPETDVTNVTNFND